MREMKDSGVEWIGEIPIKWAKTRVGNLFRFSSGDSLTNEDIQDEGLYKVYGANGLRGYYDHFNLRGKHILIGRVGALCGNVHIVNEPIWVTEHALIAKQISSCIDLDFAAKIFESMNLGQYSKASAQPVIAASVIQQLQIPIPPLKEQRCISAYLDCKCSQIDAIITRQQEVIEKLKAYKLSVITEAVTKGVNPDVPMKDSGVEWIGKIPEHWNILKLQAHTRMLTPMRDRPEKLDGDIPWVRIEDYDGKYISTSKEGLGVSLETVNEMNLKIYPVGSILCTSSCDLGKCAIVTRELVSNQRFINIIPDLDTNSDYLYYLMLSNAKRLNHLSTGTIQANLSRKAFEHLMVQFPPFAEQKEIAEYLDKKCETVELSIRKKQELIDRLNLYKKSLIYETVTGKKEI